MILRQVLDDFEPLKYNNYLITIIYVSVILIFNLFGIVVEKNINNFKIIKHH